MLKRSKVSAAMLGAVAMIALTACSSSGSKTAAAASTPAAATGSTGASTAASTAQSSSAASAASSSMSSSSASSSASSSDSASPSSSATPPAVTNKKTDWVERSGFKLKVDIVTYPYLPPAGDALQPAPNEEFLKLHIELANTGGRGAFSMMDFDVRDDANDRILASIVATDALPKDVRLDLLSLKPGEKQTGEVVFIAPKGAKGLRLVFDGTLMNRDGNGVTSGPPPVVDLGV